MSLEEVGKNSVKTDNGQLASINVIFCTTYHRKQLNLWPTSLASGAVIYSQLSACPDKMESLKYKWMSDKLQ